MNRLAAARAARAASGQEVLDLTESNPTRVGLSYPAAELAELLARGAGASYEPHPLGLPSAREALAAALSRLGDPVSADDLVLTASTSEAYGYLLKLLCEPGEAVLTGVPSYPLLDHLAALEGVTLLHFPLEPGRRYGLDLGALERALTAATRALLVVHPNNPTGAFLDRGEQDAAARLCRERGLALLSDEVFAEYAFHADARRADAAAARGDVLAFSLGGLSKSAGLPHWKLAWIRVGGPPAERRRAVAALELIADSYLSVATPVQQALPGLLALAPRLRAAIAGRTRHNLDSLTASLAPLPAVELLVPEGGWSAVVRVPHLVGDEELALALLAERGVLVHPGYFFDFPREGFLVLSLLPEPALFAEGAARLARHLARLA